MILKTVVPAPPPVVTGILSTSAVGVVYLPFDWLKMMSVVFDKDVHTHYTPNIRNERGTVANPTRTKPTSPPCGHVSNESLQERP